jgi:hypothetical protein
MSVHRGFSRNSLVGRKCRSLQIVGVFACVAAVIGGGSATAAGDTCPNEQLRSESRSLDLPDCRAYEQVTPPFKAAQLPFFAAFDSSTQALLFTSLGGFAGAEADPAAGGAHYTAERDPAGWSTTSIQAPASQFRFAKTIEEYVEDFSQGKALYFGLVPASAKPVDRRIYLRQPGANGALVQVGPLLPPETVAQWTTPANNLRQLPSEFDYRGASTDLSHLFFSYAEPNPSVNPAHLKWLWPGDTTLISPEGSFPVQSLYEYVGVGNTEPSLVGVRNDGPLRGSPHLNEDAELISQCGIVLGASGEDRRPMDSYHAISADGSTVFFTALQGGCEGRNQSDEAVLGAGPHVNELYARIDGERTVAISQPSAADCFACDTEAAAQAPAAFQGASSDGSEVFFLSEQRLISGSTGIEPQGDNLYEYDFAAAAGEKISLVAPQMAREGGVVRVAESGSRVYLVAEDDELAVNRDSDGKTAREEAETGRGDRDLYVYEPASRRFTFIAALSEADKADWSRSESRPVEATPDGRFLLFRSTNDLTPDAAGERSQIYRYDAQTGELVRISIGEDGFNDDGNSPANFPRFNASSYVGVASALNSTASGQQGLDSISDDGSYAFFTSPAALTPQALNDVCLLGREEECEGREGFAENAYEYHDGTVSLISDGRDLHHIFGSPTTALLGATPSGDDVFFETADQLVPQDTDADVDIYDAHVAGGFPAPIASAPCKGEQCQGQSGVAPLLGVPTSTTLTGTGNLASPPSTASPARKVTKKAIVCRRGKRLRRGKCVKASKAKRAKKVKRSRNHRGANR